ncbi:MAG: CU044_2847 family protein [Cyanobacteria bacterium J06643_5]
MDDQAEKIPVKLPNGTIIKVEVTETGREDVAEDTLDFAGVTNALEGITQAVFGTLEKVKPNKATVKFGMEISVDSGALTAVIVKGSGKANLEISLEWDKN